jgi:L-ascorbate metabolism protein UlaG (beta-lactamase superfamily)
MFVAGFGLILFLVGFSVVAPDGEPQGRMAPTKASSAANPAPQDLPLRVWYLGHSGFAVRSGDRLLVFDYQEEYGTPAADPGVGGLDDGTIEAADLAGLDAYVFTTHPHGDHYDEVILDWEAEAESVEYFFGWEAGENPRHHYLVGPQATSEIDGMEIYTINSHHSGVPEVAFLVHVDGHWIYHNGDYLQNYIPDFEYLNTLTDQLDLVFHAGATNDEWQYTRQARYLLEHFSPDHFFPMHYGNDEADGEGAAFAADVAARGYATQVPVPQRRGDRWELATPLHAQTTPFTIPTLDLSMEVHRQVVVDREPGQYLGHPTTVLLQDGISILTVYPQGHGRGPIVMKKSPDGGLTWSERLPVPESWATSLEVPTVFRVGDTPRLIMFSGLYPIRMAVSEDDGSSWSELESIGDFGGIVAMSSLVGLKNGDQMALFHDDGRFLDNEGERTEFHVFKTVSSDGGLSWNSPEVVAYHPEADLCEPGAIRSPDGGTIALLLRENSRTKNAFVTFSGDEGLTWTEPRELPAALTGDRHTARYGPDGRLFVSFRDMAEGSPTKGDWVGWVGTFDDIAEGREGEYRIRLMDNKNPWDTAYPGVELLPDGTFVVTTYGHWVEEEEPFIVSVRFTLDELDGKLNR